jgi:hypothetical protein
VDDLGFESWQGKRFFFSPNHPQAASYSMGTMVLFWGKVA